LDLTLTLKENLENKTIVEYPILHVITKDHSNIYEIIDTGTYYLIHYNTINIINVIMYYYLDEETSDAECTNYAKKRYNNDNGSNDNKKDEPVNYFFNDFSDEEKTDNKVERRKRSLNIPNYEELIKM